MSKEEILKEIINNAYELIPELEGQEINPDDRLVDLGANSVDRAEIIDKTVESLDLDISRVELFAAKNIGELAEVLDEKLKSTEE